MLRPLFAIALVPGCLTGDGLDEPMPAESSDVALLETVIKPPTPRASCIAGCGFAGPVTIHTSYHGTCSQWGDEYECQAQPYTLTVACIGAPCTVAPTTWSAWDATTTVTPAAGVTGIRVRMFKSVGSDYNPIEALNTVITPAAPPSSAADRIESYCNDGDGQPCVARPNKRPVYHYFTLVAGTQSVPLPSPGFELVTSAAGTAGTFNQSWLTSAPGVQTVTVRYGSLSLTKTFEVEGLDLGTESEIEPERY